MKHPAAQVASCQMRLTALTGLLLLLGSVCPLTAAEKTAAAPAPEVKGKWVHLQTEHFDAYSNGGKTAGRSLLTDLERFRWVLSKMTQLEWSTVPPVVLQFKNAPAMAPFKPLEMKSRDSIGGLFLTLADEHVILATTPDATREAQRLLRHEFVHFLTQERWGNQPLWVTEGLADFYSTFSVRNGSAVLGAAVPGHAQYLAQRRLPLERLIAIDRMAYRSLGDKDLGAFYAGSWALVHYLLYDRKGDDNAERFSQYLRLSLDRKLSPVEALTRAFQTEISDLETELTTFLRGDSCRQFQMKLDASVLEPTVNATPAATDDVAFHLGNALLLQGREAEAEAYYRLAGKLGKTPVRMSEGLGKLAWLQERPADAVERLTEAIRLGSRDFRNQYLLGLAQSQMAATSEPHGSATNQSLHAASIGAFDAAIRLQPGFAPAYHAKAKVCLGDPERLAAGAEALGRALKLEPSRAEYLFTLADYQLKQQQYSEALRTAEFLDKRTELPLPMRLEIEDLRLKARLGLQSKSAGN